MSSPYLLPSSPLLRPRILYLLSFTLSRSLTHALSHYHSSGIPHSHYFNISLFNPPFLALSSTSSFYSAGRKKRGAGGVDIVTLSQTLGCYAGRNNLLASEARSVLVANVNFSDTGSAALGSDNAALLFYRSGQIAITSRTDIHCPLSAGWRVLTLAISGLLLHKPPCQSASCRHLNKRSGSPLI